MSEEMSAAPMEEAVSEESLQGDVESLSEEALPGETPAETAKRLFKVKIDNNELEVDEDELVRGYQMTKAAQKRFQEAAQMNKRAEEFIKLLKQDPKKVLSHPDIGVDLKEFAVNYLTELQAEESLTPEQKRQRELEQRLAQFEEEKARREQEEHQRQIEEQAAKYAEDYQKQFTEVLSTSGLPKTEYTVARLAYYMQQAIQAGYDEITPKDVVGLVKSDYLNDIKSMFSASNEDILLDLLGDELTNKTVKAHMKRMKGKGSIERNPKVVDRQNKEDNVKRKKMSRDEWKKMLDERVG